VVSSAIWLSHRETPTISGPSTARNHQGRVELVPECFHSLPPVGQDLIERLFDESPVIAPCFEVVGDDGLEVLLDVGRSHGDPRRPLGLGQLRDEVDAHVITDPDKLKAGALDGFTAGLVTREGARARRDANVRRSERGKLGDAPERPGVEPVPQLGTGLMPGMDGGRAGEVRVRLSVVVHGRDAADDFVVGEDKPHVGL